MRRDVSAVQFFINDEPQVRAPPAQPASLRDFLDAEFRILRERLLARLEDQADTAARLAASAPAAPSLAPSNPATPDPPVEPTAAPVLGQRLCSGGSGGYGLDEDQGHHMELFGNRAGDVSPYSHGNSPRSRGRRSPKRYSDASQDDFGGSEAGGIIISGSEAGSIHRMLSFASMRMDGELRDAEIRWGHLVPCLLNDAAARGEFRWADNIARSYSRLATTSGQWDEHTPHQTWLSPAMSPSSVGMESLAAHVKKTSVGSVVSAGPMMERDKEKGSTWPVIHPTSNRRVVWCLIGALLLAYDAIVIPLEASTLLRGAQNTAFVWGTFVYWVLDFLFSMITGYTRDNHVELRLHCTILHYARTWMAIDLSLLILDLGFLLLDFHTGSRAFRIVRLLRLLRLVRMQKWQASLINFLSTGQSEYVELLVKIVRLLVQLLLMCHYTACAWFGVGELNLHDEFAHWGRGGSWLGEFNVASNSFLDSYAMSLHWSITQFTPSTNDIVPASTMERLFAVVVVLMGMLFFSGFLGTLAGMVNQMKSASAAKVQDRLRLLRFIRSKHISHKLGQRMLTFFDLDGGRRDRILIEEDIPVLKQLPESVRFCVHREMYLYLVQINPILNEFIKLNADCFWNVCHEAMSDHRYMAQQEVFLDGAASTVAYVVVSGCLAYTEYLRKGGDLRRQSTPCSIPPNPTASCSTSSTPSGHLAPLQVTIVDTQAWLAEAALWMKWSHRGTLVASTAVNLVKLDCDTARRIFVAHGNPLLGCLRFAACFFAMTVEDDYWRVTDIDCPAAGIAERALRMYNSQRIVSSKTPQQPDPDVADSLTATLKNTVVSKLEVVLGTGLRASGRSRFSNASQAPIVRRLGQRGSLRSDQTH